MMCDKFMLMDAVGPIERRSVWNIVEPFRT